MLNCRALFTAINISSEAASSCLLYILLDFVVLENPNTPQLFLRRTCPASALVGLEIPLLLVVIPGGERHERTTFHSGCSCWSGNGCHQRFHPRLLNRSRARTIFNVNVVLNCKAEIDNTNANKHDICIYILKTGYQINSCAIYTYKYWRLCL